MIGAPFQLLGVGPYERAQVEIEMTGERRPPHPKVDALIAEAWEARVAEAAARGQLLFPGPMCALRSWSFSAERLTLRFGQTDYREFVGTNVAHPEIGERYGEAQFANGTGVCSILETADRKMILQRRSATVFEHPGMLHVCGGSLDPIERDGALVADPFGVMAREFGEELGLAPDELTAMRCLGLARDGRTLKPDVLLHTRTSRKARSILGVAHEEHAELLAIPAPVEQMTGWLRAHWHDITPAGLACLVAYTAVEYNRILGEPWEG